MASANKLPLKTDIRDSLISGKGVFARKKIRAGETICHLTGERCTIDEMLRRVKEGKENGSDPLGIEDEIYLDLDEFPRTINHSCDPSAYIRGKNELVAIRDILAGEEVTYDYSTTMNDNKTKINAFGFEVWTCACHCGSKICRGIINQFKTLPKERRDYYIQNKFMPDFMLRNFAKILTSTKKKIEK